MKTYTPEISWHNRLPILALDIAPIAEADHYYRVATGGNDCRVYIWTINSENLEINIRAGLRRHQKSVGALRFSANQVLASGDDDGYIYLWKKKIEEPLQTTSNAFLNDDGFKDVETWQHFKVLRGHVEDICDLSWSRDGNLLLSGSVDNSSILWDAAKGVKIWCSDLINGYVQGVAIDPHTHFIAALSSDRTLRVYSLKEKKIVSLTRRMNIKRKYEAFFCDDTVQTFCRRLEFSPDGQFLVVPTSRMVERAQLTQKPMNIFLVFKHNCLKKPTFYYQIGREVALCARFSPVVYKLRKSEQNFWNIPYRIVFAIATSRSVIIYDSQQPIPIAYISNIHFSRLTDIAWSSDGQLLVVSSYDGYVSIVTFDENEIGEIYTETLLEPMPDVKEAPVQPPAPPQKVTQTLTIRKYLIKRS